MQVVATLQVTPETTNVLSSLHESSKRRRIICMAPFLIYRIAYLLKYPDRIGALYLLT